MPGALTYAAKNHSGNEFLRGLDPVEFAFPVYLALFTTDPGDVGDLSGEVVAAEYARQLITFGAPSSPGVFTNAIECLFPSIATGWGTIGWVGIVDSPTTLAGLMIVHGTVGPITPPAGRRVWLQIGQGTVTWP